MADDTVTGEAAADHTIGHVERGVGQLRFEVDDQSRQGRAPPRRRIVREELRRRYPAFADELPESIGMNAARGVSRDPETAHKIDTSSAAGELVFRVFGAIAHSERRLIAERTKDGIAAARAKGKRGRSIRTRSAQP